MCVRLQATHCHICAILLSLPAFCVGFTLHVGLLSVMAGCPHIQRFTGDSGDAGGEKNRLEKRTEF